MFAEKPDVELAFFTYVTHNKPENQKGKARGKIRRRKGEGITTVLTPVSMPGKCGLILTS